MELIDREPLLKKWGDGCEYQDDCHGDCSECAFPSAVDDVKNAPITDAVPFEVINQYIHMWKSRAKDSSNRERAAYALMAYAAEVILENYKMLIGLGDAPPMDGKTIEFKRWKMFEEEERYDAERNPGR